TYIAKQSMSNQSIDRDLKKGSAELLVLSLLEARQRHGYEISKLIETRSKGAVRFRVASLYPLLYRLEDRGYIQGRWVKKDGARRKLFPRLTPAGPKIPPNRRSRWETFVEAIQQITATENA